MPIFFSFGLTYRFKSHLIYIYSRPCYHTADPGITLTPIPMAVINTGTQLPGTHVNLTSFVQHLSRLWQGAISSIISGPNHNIIDSWVWRDTQQTWPSVCHWNFALGFTVVHRWHQLPLLVCWTAVAGHWQSISGPAVLDLYWLTISGPLSVPHLFADPTVKQRSKTLVGHRGQLWWTTTSMLAG